VEKSTYLLGKVVRARRKVFACLMVYRDAPVNELAGRIPMHIPTTLAIEREVEKAMECLVTYDTAEAGACGGGDVVVVPI
jgi:hypothetical protein